MKDLYGVYTGTSDISSYFIELGINLLARDGHVWYITTNKFFNTGYGQPIRQMLVDNNIRTLINFEQVEVFKDILVSSVILGVQKAASSQSVFTYERFYQLNANEFKEEFSNREISGTYRHEYLDDGEWSFADVNALALKQKIEQAGTVLGKVDGVHVYRGVTTGYNPAFIITCEIKDTLVNLDSKNIHLIKNMLQGRNIKKWYFDESEEYMIFTRKGTDISKYPHIQEYLRHFYEDLKPKVVSSDERGRKPGNYKWFEILDNTAYYPHFEKTKIIWGLTSDKWAFTLDTEKHYLPSNAYILTSENIPVLYLLGLLNSKLLHYYFGFIGVMTAGGAYTLKAATIEAMPIAIGSEQEQSAIISLVSKILDIKERDHNADVSAFENQIDAVVYQIYGLSDDDISIITNSLSD